MTEDLDCQNRPGASNKFIEAHFNRLSKSETDPWRGLYERFLHFGDQVVTRPSTRPRGAGFQDREHIRQLDPHDVSGHLRTPCPCNDLHDFRKLAEDFLDLQ